MLSSLTDTRSKTCKLLHHWFRAASFSQSKACFAIEDLTQLYTHIFNFKSVHKGYKYFLYKSTLLSTSLFRHAPRYCFPDVGTVITLSCRGQGRPVEDGQGDGGPAKGEEVPAIDVEYSQCCCCHWSRLP